MMGDPEGNFRDLKFLSLKPSHDRNFKPQDVLKMAKRYWTLFGMAESKPKYSRSVSHSSFLIVKNMKSKTKAKNPMMKEFIWIGYQALASCRSQEHVHLENSCKNLFPEFYNCGEAMKKNTSMTLIHFLKLNMIFPFYEKVKEEETQGYIQNGIRLFFYDFQGKSKIFDLDAEEIKPLKLEYNQIKADHLREAKKLEHQRRITKRTLKQNFSEIRLQ